MQGRGRYQEPREPSQRPSGRRTKTPKGPSGWSEGAESEGGGSSVSSAGELGPENQVTPSSNTE